MPKRNPTHKYKNAALNAANQIAASFSTTDSTGISP
jgi:hypothetical protein